MSEIKQDYNKLVLLVFILSILLSANSAHAATVTWSGAVSGNWSDGSKWSSGVPPTADDDVAIVAEGTYSITLDTDPTVNSLLLGGVGGSQTVSATNRTITVKGGGTIGYHAAVNLVGSRVSGGGLLTNQGTVNVTGSTIATALHNAGTINTYQSNMVTGTFTTQAGSQVTVVSDSSHYWVGGYYDSSLVVAHGFTNYGTITLSDVPHSADYGGYPRTATFGVTDGTLVNVGSITSIAGSNGWGYRTLAAVLDNRGTVTASYPLTVSAASARHTNSGTITVQADVTFSQSGTSPSFINSGGITIAPGKTLSIAGGGDFVQNGTLTGDGTLSLSALGSATFTTTYSVALTLSEISAVTLPTSFTDKGSLNLTGVTAVIPAGTVLGSVTINNSTVTIPAGSGMTSLTISNSMVTLSEDLDTAVTSLSASGSTIYGSGLSIVNNVGRNVTLTNSTVNVATITNRGGLNLIGSTVNGASLANQGSLNLTGSTLNVALNNGGSINAFQNNTLNGTVTTQPGSSVTVSSDSTHYWVGGYYDSTLTVAHGFINNGTITLTDVPHSLDYGGVPRTATFAVTDGTVVNRGTILSIAGSQGWGYRAFAAALDNQGTLSVTYPLAINKPLAPFANNGAISINAGQNLSITGGGSFAQNGTITGDGTLSLTNLASATFTTTSNVGLSMSGIPVVTLPTGLTDSGALNLAGVTAVIPAGTTLGTVNITNSTVTIPAGTGMTALNVTNSTVTLSENLTTAVTSLSVTGSTIYGAGVTITNGAGKTATITNSTVNGSAVVNQGTLNLSGSTITTATLVNQGSLNLTGSILNSAVDNSGTITTYQNTWLNGGLTTGSNSQITVISDSSHYWVGGYYDSTFTVSNGFTNNGTITLTDIPHSLDYGGSPRTATFAVTNGILVNAGTINSTGGSQGWGYRTLAAKLNNQGTLSISYPLTINQSGASAAFNNEGQISIGSGQTLTITGGGSFTQNGRITGDGTLSLNNLASATFTTTCNVGLSMSGIPVVTLPTPFTDRGTLTLTGVTAVLPAGTTLGAVNIINSTVTIPVGTGMTSLTVTNSTVTLSENLDTAVTSLSASGSTLFGSGLSLTNGVGKNITLTNSTVTVATVTNLDTLNLIGSTINGSSFANRGTLNLTGSTLNMALNNAGTINGYQNNALNGSVTTESGSSLTVSSDSSHYWVGGYYDSILTVANGFTNNGTITLTDVPHSLDYGGYPRTATLAVTVGTLINNGTIASSTGSQGWGYRTLAAALDNRGTLLVNYPLGINKASAHHTNSGTITANADVTVSQSGATPTFANSGAIAIGSGKNFTINGGTFSNADATFITGDGTLNSSGTIIVPFGVTVVPEAASCAWQNHNGGPWSTAANWSCGRIPDVHDAVVITIDGTYTVTLDVSPHINSLTLGGAVGTQTLSANGKIVTLEGSGTIGANGVLTLSDTIITGNGILTSLGTVNLSSGRVAVPFDNGGTLNIFRGVTLTPLTTRTGSTLTIRSDNSSDSILWTDGFTNNGTINLTHVGYGGTTARLFTSGTVTNLGAINILTGDGAGGRALSSGLDNRGILTVGYPLSMDRASAVYLNSGAINVNAPLAINQSGTSPSFTNKGIIKLAPGQTMTVNGGSFDLASGTISGAAGGLSLTNCGTVTINHGLVLGALTLANMGVNVTEAFTLTGALSLTNVIANFGSTFTTDSLSLATSTATFAAGFTTANSTITNGSVTFGAAASFGNLTLNNVVTTIAAGSTFSTLTLNGAVVTISDSFSTASVPLSISNSTLAGAAVIITNAAGKTVNLSGATTINTALDNFGTITVSQGTQQNGAFTMEPGSLLHIDATGGYDSAFTVAGGFTNSGTIELRHSGYGGYSARLSVLNGTLINGGTIRSIYGDGAGGRVVSAALDNRGLLAVDYPLTMDKQSAAHSNSGTITLGADLTLTQGGIAAGFTNGGTVTLAGHGFNVSGGAFSNAPAGFVTGPGSLTVSGAAFSNGGTIKAGGNLAVTVTPREMIETATGVIALTLGGAAANQYDRLTVGGGIHEDGTVTVGLADGYAPKVGDRFTLLNYGSKSGGFAVTNLPTLVGKHFATTESGNALTLTVVPDVTAPTVVSVSPADGTTSTAPSGVITGTFSTAMSPETINATTFTVNNGDVIGTVNYNAATKTATFTPSAPLSFNTAYHVTFAPGIRDLTGSGLSSAYSWSFTVQPPCVSAPAGLVSLWKGEGDAVDQTGLNNGTMKNGAAFGTGKTGQAFSFDMADDYVAIPDSPALNPLRDMTMQGWLYIKSFDKTWQTVFWKGNIPENTDDTRQYGLWVNSNGSLHFASTPQDRIGVGQLSINSVAGTLAAGQWNHFAAVISSNSRTMKLFINGVEQATGIYSGDGIRNSSGPLYLGNGSTLNTGLNGLLDEVSLYSRALTAAEIKAAYAADTSGLCGASLDSAPTVDGTLTAVPGSGQIALSWSPASDSDGIVSYRLVSSTSGYPADCSGTALFGDMGTSYTNGGLNNGLPYYYRLCAVDALGHTSTGATAVAVPFAATNFWVSPVSGNWSDGNKWSRGTAPTADDDISITVAGSYTITLDSNPTVHSFILGGVSGTQAMALNSRTLAISGASTLGNHGVMNLNGSMVAGTALLTNLGCRILKTFVIHFL